MLKNISHYKDAVASVYRPVILTQPTYPLNKHSLAFSINMRRLFD